jgi:hypothetical protein
MESLNKVNGFVSKKRQLNSLYLADKQQKNGRKNAAVFRLRDR